MSTMPCRAFVSTVGLFLSLCSAGCGLLLVRLPSWTLSRTVLPGVFSPLAFVGGRHAHAHAFHFAKSFTSCETNGRQPAHCGTCGRTAAKCPFCRVTTRLVPVRRRRSHATWRGDELLPKANRASECPQYRRCFAGSKLDSSLHGNGRMNSHGRLRRCLCDTFSKEVLTCWFYRARPESRFKLVRTS